MPFGDFPPKKNTSKKHKEVKTIKEENPKEIEEHLDTAIDQLRKERTKKIPLIKAISIPYTVIEILINKMSRQKQKHHDGRLRWADPNCQEPDFLLIKQVKEWLADCKAKGVY